jgi:hypothetical protein
MKNIIKKSLQAVLIVPFLAFGVSLAVPALQPATAFAAGDCTTLSISNGADCAQATTGQPTNLFGPGGIFTKITDVLLFIIGAISVIMLIIGGIRYVVSGGDSSAVTGAKNTILYAVIGIVVALLAYALVHFVITSFASNG